MSLRQTRILGRLVRNLVREGSALVRGLVGDGLAAGGGLASQARGVGTNEVHHIDRGGRQVGAFGRSFEYDFGRLVRNLRRSVSALLMGSLRKALRALSDWNIDGSCCFWLWNCRSNRI